MPSRIRARIKNPFHFHLVELRDLDRTGSGHFEILECGYLTNTVYWNQDHTPDSYWRFYHNAEPGAWVTVKGRRLQLTPDHVVIVPAGTPFSHRGTRGKQYHLWIHFRPPAHFPLTLRQLSRPLHPVVAGNIDHLRQRILHHKEGDIRDRQLLYHASQAVLNSWLVHTPFELKSDPSPAITRLLEQMDELIPHPLSNQKLAQIAGLNIKSLIRKFDGHFGMTPARYVAMRRIREACRLLTETDHSIEKIAEAVGFANRHHFSRIFNRQTGQGPSQFRQIHAQAMKKQKSPISAKDPSAKGS